MAQSQPMHQLQQYFDRFQALKAYSDNKDDLIQELLFGWNAHKQRLDEQNVALQQEVEDLRLDLEASTSTRRELQQQLQAKKREIEHTQVNSAGLKARNPYVIVLIDGDGLLFQEKWISQGVEGGKRAAYCLRQAIAEHCLDEFGSEVEVIAKAVANVSGLAKAMLRDGAIMDANQFRDFSIGFTQAKASFDFIDVGYGKERADLKIKETTRWHLKNYNCRKIFLGISHDSGYAPFLDEILQDEDTRNRVAVLEGFPTTRELANTGVTVLDNLTEEIFRCDKIPSNYGFSNGSGSHKTSPIMTSPSLASDTTTSFTSGKSPSTWPRAIQAVTPPPQITTPLAVKKLAPPPPKERPEWNPGRRGPDPAIAYRPEILEQIRDRPKEEKLCNKHYLRGNCPQRSICQFVHDLKITKAEKDAIAFLSRQNPCGDGQDCYIEDCIYGHNCPHMKDGYCPHPFCKFPARLHPPGSQFANKRIEFND